MDLRDRGPVGGLVAWQASADGIDAEGKQLVEFFLERIECENISADQVPVKGLEVSEIKENAVPLGNGPLIKALRAHHAKEFIGEGAGFNHGRGKRAARFRQGLLGVHVHLPVLARIKLFRSPEIQGYADWRLGVNRAVEESRSRGVEKSRVRLLDLLLLDSLTSQLLDSSTAASLQTWFKNRMW